MNLVRFAIDRPIAVIAAVLMVVLFGLVALETIPIQLTPDVRKPIITVQTLWPGAAPAEVEREIVNRQEEMLKGVEGLEEVESRSENGRARVTLTFAIGTNMDRALLLVANRLDRVSGYPDEADRPTLRTASAEDNAIAWFAIQTVEGNSRPVHTYGDFVEEVIQDRVERVEGVSRTDAFGGVRRELHITVQPERMAQFGLTVTAITQKLRAANASVSAGDVEEGKRRYLVRAEGDLNTPEAVRAVVLRTAADSATGRIGRVTMGDIAEVSYGYSEPRARIRRLGKSAVVMNAKREAGANVIETMEGVRAAVAELNESVLPGEGLVMEQVYDETDYIVSAIDLVRQNIVVGGALAAIMLLLFLRSWRPTLIVSLAIPVSVVGSFVAMAMLGRSLNVVSLAGIAFAVGMVVDAAIVVLENIYRLRERGMPPREAALRGASQVWGAILVSALTTVLVFVPILAMDLEVGQLFRDIAVAISVSVMLSLIVAITVIPALSRRLLATRVWTGGRFEVPVLDGFARRYARATLAYAGAVVRNRKAALVSVAAIVGLAVAVAWWLTPKLDYLPDGSRNFVLGRVLPPPGYNLRTNSEIAREIEDSTRALWASETGPEPEPGGPPKIANFFFVALPSYTFVGASSTDPARPEELVPVLQGASLREPGTFGFFTVASIFGRGIGGKRSIDLDISGPDLETVMAVAGRATGMTAAALPRGEGNQLRPIPGLELGAPEVRVMPDRLRLADNGVSARELADTIDAFNDGLRVARVTIDGRRTNLVLKGPTDNVASTQGIDFLPVVTRNGVILPASSLAKIEVTSGPTEIRHKERVRTVTLQIRPRAQMPLEEAMDLVRAEVMDPLRDGGLPAGVKLRLSGAADQLTITWNHIVLDLLIAVAIVFLVMAVLFESFVYPLVIMISVPLATAGGVLGLAVLNLFAFQPLDMLTLLGFIILVGIVVNNAILLVHQTLFHIREGGMAPPDAIREATRDRLRPIYMSTLTSIFGMAPLVLFPGAGSELYRGLGSVVLGGLSLSAVLTLTIIPPLLGLILAPLEERRRGRLEAPAPAAAE